MKRSLAAIILALSVVIPLRAQTTPAPAAAAPGDVVRLSVWRAPEFTGDFPISQRGTIQHPLLSEVRAAGVPEEEIRAQIAQVLRQYETEPRFVFTILHRVAVTGEVRVPGLYPLPAETTLSQAVAAAGGPSEYASLGRVRLIRGGDVTDLDLSGEEAGTADLPIRPGDRIVIPRQLHILRDVVGPGASVLGAIGVLITIVRN